MASCFLKKFLITFGQQRLVLIFFQRGSSDLVRRSSVDLSHTCLSSHSPHPFHRDCGMYASKSYIVHFAPIFQMLIYVYFVYDFLNNNNNSSMPVERGLAPVPNVSDPTQHADFRPISVTQVLTSIMERIIVQKIIYPNFQKPIAFLTFRPTGSTTAAMITFLHKVTSVAYQQLSH